jgi:hypothetical protein
MNAPHHPLPLTLHRLSRRLLLTTAATAGGLLALPRGATAARALRPVSAHATLVTLELFDRDNGQILPVYDHGGERHVPGHPGARYALRLRNLTARRVLVVLSVDGINVISGETAAWQQAGYVLDPGRWTDITGWRKSDSDVAAFTFASLQHSYAARTGRPDHVGVIGMAAFREHPPAPPVAPPAPPIAGRAEERASSMPAPAAPQAKPQEARREPGSATMADSARLGTGHGPREGSLTRRVHFERASAWPDQVTRLRYDSLQRLQAAGIVPSWPRPGRPSPFPGNAAGYVPDPPRW